MKRLNNRVKVLMVISVLAISTIQNTAYSQLYISPLLGVSCMHLKGENDLSVYYEKYEPIVITEKGFNHIEPVIGINLINLVNKDFFISLASTLNEKKVEVYTYRHLIESYDLKFLHLNSEIIFDFRFYNHLFLGYGVNVSYFFNYYSGLGNGYFVKSDWPKKIFYSLTLNSSYFYKRFLFQVKYFHSLKTQILKVKPDLDLYSRGYKGINGFEITIGYMLKIYDKNNVKNDINCPRF